MDRIERIRGMEERMDRVRQWVETVSSALDQKDAVQAEIYELSAYYESDLWMEDYEADEAGELPEELKRGILSEDELYNLLAEYEELILRLRGSGEERKTER